MNISLGIVGLPNVGKSTLFNAITNISVPAENYPFCTIDPNIGVVEVKDGRLEKLSNISKSLKTVYPVVEFVDIAGLVKGAAKGEGLGNKFLSNIKNCDAIIHIIRAFESTSILHVENRVDPLSDKQIIETELILKDLESIEQKIIKLSKDAKRDKDAKLKYDFLNQMKAHLEKGFLALDFLTPDGVDADAQKLFRSELFLITDKPTLYLLNIDDVIFDEKSLVKKYRELLNLDDNKIIIPINIKQEFELSILDKEERELMSKELGIEFSAINTVINAGYDLLGLMTYFTSGEQESRGWTIEKNSNAQEAAGVIHTDFFNKFIAAEVVSFNDFVEFGGWIKCKEYGKVRLEGKTYIVKDGDVMIFKHGA